MSESLVILDATPAETYLDAAWAPLEAIAPTTVHAHSEPDEVVERIAGASIAIINKVRITAEVLAEAPELRFVGILATGYDNVDLEACRERGVAVANVPGYSTSAVAQWVFAALLEVWNDVAGHAAAVADGAWARCSEFSFFTRPITELAGRTLVIVGTGAIGGRVAAIAEAFGMRVVSAQVPGRPSKADRVPLAEALAEADAVTLHCPLTGQTAGMVDDAFLRSCKPGAVLINSGRGGLLDESAVVEALDDGRLSHACLDVLTPEPPAIDHPLTGHPKALVTPHIAWGSTDARRRLIAEVAANLRAFRAGERRNRVD